MPVRQARLGAGPAAQLAFQQAVLAVESLREQLRELCAGQAEARRRYWQQVGPVAAAVVAARRDLYAPLEQALLLGGFRRREETQIRDLILGNAQALQARFGEDEGAILRKYSPVVKPPDLSLHPDPAPDSDAVPPPLPAHEQAARTRAGRPTKTQRRTQAAAEADARQLATNAKTLYRQLARTHHPDLERDPAKHAQRTVQMQRITQAYAADDLYTLLQVLAESGPADEADASVLAHYTRALQQQQVSLKKELNELKYGPLGFAGSSGKKRELELRQLKRDLRAETDYVRHVGQQMAEPAILRELLRELSTRGQATI